MYAFTHVVRFVLPTFFSCITTCLLSQKNDTIVNNDKEYQKYKDDSEKKFENFIGEDQKKYNKFLTEQKEIYKEFVNAEVEWNRLTTGESQYFTKQDSVEIENGSLQIDKSFRKIIDQALKAAEDQELKESLTSPPPTPQDFEIKANTENNTVPSIYPLPSGKGVKTSGFGFRFHPVVKRRKFHTGVDIGAPQGTSIIATASGIVEKAGWNGNYGRYVLVNHKNGYKTAYAHQSEILVNIGNTVKKGEIIGKVGTTGMSTGNHLHYEVIKNGKKVNPENYYKKE